MQHRQQQPLPCTMPYLLLNQGTFFPRNICIHLLCQSCSKLAEWKQPFFKVLLTFPSTTLEGASWDPDLSHASHQIKWGVIPDRPRKLHPWKQSGHLKNSPSFKESFLMFLLHLKGSVESEIIALPFDVDCSTNCVFQRKQSSQRLLMPYARHLSCPGTSWPPTSA